MSPATKTLLRSLLKPFYRENGGLILFLLFIMFAAVGRANDTGLLEYHYNLIIGLLHNADMFLIVFLIWLLYAVRAVSFVSRTLRTPAFAFLAEYARMNRGALFARLLLVQFLFFLPVLSYAGIIVVIAFRLQMPVRAAGILSLLLGFCLIPAELYRFLFSRPGSELLVHPGEKPVPQKGKFYWQFLLRYLISRKKALFLSVKLFSAGMLWGMLRQLPPVNPDLRMMVLFYSFGLFGHSVLVFACREMEAQGLGFYRGLPVSLWRRQANYAVFYAMLFVPETLLLTWYCPGHLPPGDAITLFALGFGTLLLLNSILFLRYFTKADFLKCCCGIFLFLFIAVLAGVLRFLAVFIPALAVGLFFRSYYRFDGAARPPSR